MSKASAPFDIVNLAEVDSTNRYIKDEIHAGAAEWRVAVAGQQTRGYGRQGKSWSSPLGGLYFSVLLRPAKHGIPIAEYSSLSLCASLAVRQSLSSCKLKGDLGIKWPNDIMFLDTAFESRSALSERDFSKSANPQNIRKSRAPKEGLRTVPWAKIAGISLELVKQALCLGVGINVFRHEENEISTKNKVSSEDEAPFIDSKYLPAYLAENREEDSFKGAKLNTQVRSVCLDEVQMDFIEQLLFSLLVDLEKAYNTWIAEGFSFFKDEYQASSFLQGKRVQLLSLSEDTLHEGVVCDVDEEGRLCLIDDLGSLTRVSSGEVRLM